MNRTARDATGSWLAMIGMSFCLAACWLGSACAQEAAPRPLPWAASWCVGHFKPAEQYSPDWQIEMIEKGHHLFLSIAYGGRTRGDYSVWERQELDDKFILYCKQAVLKAAERKLPICLVMAGL
ncbi:MAG: hypothetical protein FJ290_22725 [Planctomycetes bacterium]|nr:hypothetical protein [Planctomycetota bacterium]